MKSPKLSVIIPVYNVEKYLHRCVDSILVQTFPNFEILLVDDGSLDNSGKICDEYSCKDSRVRVFHKENGNILNENGDILLNASGIGVDVSQWQGKIDWETIKRNQEIDFVIKNFLKSRKLY